MKVCTFLITLALVSLSFGEEDARCKVVGPANQAHVNPLIDPDKSIFGMPLGTSEDEFIQKNGKPTGYVRLMGDETAMLYGKSHAFLFKDGKLAGILVTHNTMDWELSKSIGQYRSFPDHSDWQLSNGLKPDMTLAAVRKILGDKLFSEDAPRRYHQQFKTDLSLVKLSFSFMSGKSDDDEEAYSLRSVLIRPRSEENQ